MAKSIIELLDLDAEAILLKADANPDLLTIQSSLSGTAFAIDKTGGILILEKHQFYRATLDDMRVIHQEMEYVIEQAERWQRS